MIHTEVPATPTYCYVKNASEFMRETPDPLGRVASEACHSEEITVLQKENGWALIMTACDAYKGWVREEAICELTSPFFTAPAETVAKVNRLKAHIYDRKDTEYGPILSLPFGSRVKILEELDGSTGRWLKIGLVDGTVGFIQRGDIATNPKPISMDGIVEFAGQFMSLPYTWGGRTTNFGFDCSGFTQHLFREMGISIPRDSKDQFTWDGFKPIELGEVKKGDLIFFGLAEDKIRHVVFCIDNNQFIHTSVKENMPYLRISSLSDPEWNGSGAGACTYRAARRLK